MTARNPLILAVLCLMPVFAAGIAGKWTASIESPIGTQHYVYDFKVNGEKLTGTAKNSMGDTATLTTESKISGDTVASVEVLKVAVDGIKFVRQVAEVATEEFVAKRAK